MMTGPQIQRAGDGFGEAESGMDSSRPMNALRRSCLDAAAWIAGMQAWLRVVARFLVQPFLPSIRLIGASTSARTARARRPGKFLKSCVPPPSGTFAHPIPWPVFP